MRTLGILVALAWCVLPAAGADLTAPPATLREIERAAKELAKRGHPEALAQACDALAALGQDAEKVADLRAKLEPIAKRAPRAPTVKHAVTAIERALKAAEAWFDGLTGESKTAAARALVLLDASHPGANAELRRTNVGGRWVEADLRACLERRQRIRNMLQQARQLPLGETVDESRHPLLLAVTGQPGIRITCGKMVFHFAQPRAKALRIFRQTVRASAVTRWLLEEQLLPLPLEQVFVVLENNAQYQRSIVVAAEKGWIPPERIEDAKQTSNWWSKTYEWVNYGPTEAYLEAGLLADILASSRAFDAGAAQPCLELGIGNWVGLTFLGQPMAGFLYYDTTGGGGGAHGGDTKSGPVELGGADRKTMRQLGEAGIAGCRSYIAWLARRAEDPPWTNCWLDQIGKIQGDDRLKDTIVVEFLAERGPLAPFLEATRTARGSVAQQAPVYEKALGEPIGAFEHRWKRWLLPELADGVVQRCAAPPAGQLSPEDAATLEYLNAIRRTAFRGPLHPTSFTPVIMEPSLSEGCRLHGAYLVKHPEQAAAWPDAHEEYPDREGFTPEGCRAGGASVIAPGSKGPQDAIDGWMGTYYHRLPLLHPGLLRIGWGNVGGFACLDSASMVARGPEGDMVIVWPADKQRDVPLRFNPELPNPVPGEDQATWGYPITLQLFALTDDHPSIVSAMTVRDGGTVLEGWFISPETPYNPELAPPAAYGFIPKSPLRPSTKYSVTATFVNGPSRSWTFTTGK